MAVAWRWGRDQPESALSGELRERLNGGGTRWRRMGMVAGDSSVAPGPVALPRNGGSTGRRRTERGVRRMAWLRHRLPLRLVEATRCIAGPAQHAVVAMGASPRDLPALVTRRREHRVPGVGTR